MLKIAPEAGAAMRPAPPVEARNLRKTFKGVKAVDGLSFTLEPGTVTALLGGNGAGKTTAIAMLLGLITPTSGEVRAFGCDMRRARHRVAHRMNFQSPYVDMPMRLTVWENLAVYARLYGVLNIEARVRSLAAELGLSDFLDRPTGKLSAGQKTRVGLAKALLNAPELLLLDEPTASLDPDTADWVRAKLSVWQAERGATILLASHNMAEVERLADRIILLERGRIIADATPSSLLETYNRATLEEVFLDVARRGGDTVHPEAAP